MASSPLVFCVELFKGMRNLRDPFRIYGIDVKDMAEGCAEYTSFRASIDFYKAMRGLAERDAPHAILATVDITNEDLHLFDLLEVPAGTVIASQGPGEGLSRTMESPTWLPIVLMTFCGIYMPEGTTHLRVGFLSHDTRDRLDTGWHSLDLNMAFETGLTLEGVFSHQGYERTCLTMPDGTLATRIKGTIPVLTGTGESEFAAHMSGVTLPQMEP